MQWRGYAVLMPTILLHQSCDDADPTEATTDAGGEAGADISAELDAANNAWAPDMADGVPDIPTEDPFALDVSYPCSPPEGMWNETVVGGWVTGIADPFAPDVSYPCSPPEAMWTETVAGWVNDIAVFDDGFAFATSGVLYQSPPGIADLVIRTDQNGAEVWRTRLHTDTLSRRFSGTRAIVPTDADGVAVVGAALGEYDEVEQFLEVDVTIVILDEDGDILWSATHGLEGRIEGATDLAGPLADGGFIFVGFRSSETEGFGDAWAVRTDQEGNEVWQTAFGGSSYQSAQAVTVDEDGGFVVAGHSGASIGEGVWLVHLDSDGNVDGEARYAGNSAWDLVAAPERGLAVLAVEEDMRSRLLVIDAAGDVRVNKAIEIESVFYGRTLLPMPDGGYVVGGDGSDGSEFNFGLVRTDSSGSIQWVLRHGQEFSGEGPVARTTDGGFVAAVPNRLQSGAAGTVVRFGPEPACP